MYNSLDAHVHVHPHGDYRNSLGDGDKDKDTDRLIRGKGRSSQDDDDDDDDLDHLRLNLNGVSGHGDGPVEEGGVRDTDMDTNGALAVMTTTSVEQRKALWWKNVLITGLFIASW
jgi:hypothetical protein